MTGIPLINYTGLMISVLYVNSWECPKINIAESNQASEDFSGRIDRAGQSPPTLTTTPESGVEPQPVIPVGLASDFPSLATESSYLLDSTTDSSESDARPTGITGCGSTPLWGL